MYLPEERVRRPLNTTRGLVSPALNPSTGGATGLCATSGPRSDHNKRVQNVAFSSACIVGSKFYGSTSSFLCESYDGSLHTRVRGEKSSGVFVFVV